MTTRFETIADRPRAAKHSLSFVTLVLILLNVGVSAYQGMLGMSWINPSPDEQIAWGGNLAMLTLTGDWWRLATSMFLHGGLLHLFMNMYMLVLIGPIAEHRFGHGGMLLAYLAGGVAASCVSALWLGSQTVETDAFGQPVARLVVSVGASGALMAIAGALLASSLVRGLSTEAPSSADASFGKSLAQVLAINVGMGFVIPGVDNGAHIGGLLAGLAIGIVPELARRSGSWLITSAARFGTPLLVGAAFVWLTLHARDWPELEELRSSYEQQQAIVP